MSFYLYVAIYDFMYPALERPLDASPFERINRKLPFFKVKKRLQTPAQWRQVLQPLIPSYMFIHADAQSSCQMHCKLPQILVQQMLQLLYVDRF